MPISKENKALSNGLHVFYDVLCTNCNHFLICKQNIYSIKNKEDRQVALLEMSINEYNCLQDTECNTNNIYKSVFIA